MKCQAHPPLEADEKILAPPPDVQDQAAGQAFPQPISSCARGQVGAETAAAEDAAAGQEAVQAAGDRLDLGKLGHPAILPETLSVVQLLSSGKPAPAPEKFLDLISRLF
jgi:hypothetical protein